MVNYGISWGINVQKTHRNGAKWLTKVKKMQNLWQFKSLCPCQKNSDSVCYRCFSVQKQGLNRATAVHTAALQPRKNLA